MSEPKFLTRTELPRFIEIENYTKGDLKEVERKITDWIELAHVVQ
jgi:hypothetical protein